MSILLTHYYDINEAWLYILRSIITNGHYVSPRGKRSLELNYISCGFDMKKPVLTSVKRNLSYVFLAAEALWILDGSDKVDDIVKYNKYLLPFSDDGKIFYGAYGPRFVAQFEYIVDILLKDNDTRQAVITLWKPSPKRSKDIPCTVSLTFNIRNDKLNCYVNMRSNDMWLGFPYDMFTFTMISLKILSFLNIKNDKFIDLGILFYISVSSHIYEKNLIDVHKILENRFDNYDYNSIPDDKINDWDFFEKSLIACRDNNYKEIVNDNLWCIRPRK